MEKFLAKISFIIVIIILLVSCNATKHLNEDEFLLTEHHFEEDENSIRPRKFRNTLKLEPNTKTFGTPLKLHIYNLAKQKPDTLFEHWFYKKPRRPKRMVNLLSKKQVVNLKNSYIKLNQRIQDLGEKPAILEKEKIEATKNNVKAWYWNNGWFNAEISHEVKKDSSKQTARVDYFIRPGNAFMIDSLTAFIDSHVVDSIYQANTSFSSIKIGKQFKTEDFDVERERITRLMRNNGIFNFKREHIKFTADTIETDGKANISLRIEDLAKNEKLADSLAQGYRLKTISEVNIFTNYSIDNKNAIVSDSVHYDGYQIYSFGKLEYKPKVLTDAVFIKENQLFSEKQRTQTFERFSDMRVFKYPNIQYQDDPRDESGESMIANVYLTPREKFGFSISNDVSQSNIVDFGLGFNTSLLVRNVFKGAEILEISGRGIIGSSSDAASSSNQFFNVNEIGANARLSWPKIAFPIKTDQLIANDMSPFTSLNLGFSSQQNIGLDRRNFTGSFSYAWQPRSRVSHQLDLVNVQFVNNLNLNNYFNVFGNSFNQLNNLALNYQEFLAPSLFETNQEGEPTKLIIPQGTDAFINELQSTNVPLNDEENQLASSIIERQERLTENNLIIASNFVYNYSDRLNIEDQGYFQFRGKVELAGNLLAGLASPLGLESNDNNNYDLFGVQFSQYAKTELSFIKQWDIDKKRVIATRVYTGIAIPYGNANSIPFIRSFFAGGPNDNRGWQPYDLGPGKTGGVNDFNEANFKIALNAEYRFNLFGSWNAALFVDAGNIWNVMDNVTDENAIFQGVESLGDLAIGSGFGIRYDLSFFVIRVDVGFKTFEPNPQGGDWLNNYNFSHAVYNFGINYPF